MACKTPAPSPGEQLLPGDRLEEIDTTLYHLQSICGVIDSLSTACPLGARTDGIDPEPFHVLFGWIGDELRDIRLGLEEINKELTK